jgi:hypothetical protein
MATPQVPALRCRRTIALAEKKGQKIAAAKKKTNNYTPKTKIKALHF